MAPAAAGGGLSEARLQYAGPNGLKGIIYNGKTSAIAFFASLGGLVYGCMYRRLSHKLLMAFDVFPVELTLTMYR